MMLLTSQLARNSTPIRSVSIVRGYRLNVPVSKTIGSRGITSRWLRNRSRVIE